MCFIIQLGVMALFFDDALGNKTLAEWKREVIRNKTDKSVYDKNVLPQQTSQAPVNVTMNLTLKQVVSIKERQQILTANVWYHLKWTDYRLAWKEEDFGNVTTVDLFIQEIWQPDIGLHNDVSVENKDTGEYYQAKILSSGEVNFKKPEVIQCYCEMNISYFPFDEQGCNLTYTSWSHDISQLYLTTKYPEGSINHTHPNSGWDILEMSAEVAVKMYDESNFSRLTFTVKLKRKPNYFLYNLVLPGVCISALALLVFCLPPDSGGKVGVSITALLATVVLMRSVADHIPRSATVPLLSRYFGAVMILMTISTCLTCLVCKMNWLGVNGVKVPPVIRKLLLDFLAKALCMQRMVQAVKEVSQMQENIAISKNAISIDPTGPASVEEPPVITVSDTRRLIPPEGGPSVSMNEGIRRLTPQEGASSVTMRRNQAKGLCDSVRLSADAQRLSNMAESLSAHAVARGQHLYVPHPEKTQLDWIVCAMVLERSLFVVLFVIIIIMSMVMLFN